MAEEQQVQQKQAQRVSLFALYKTFFWVGLFSFGGGMTPWIRRQMVVVHGWMKDEDFMPGVALAQILPGVNSTNLAVYVGQHVRGVLGATTALAGLLTAPFILVLIAGGTYKYLLSQPLLHSFMIGVAATAIGMLLSTGIASVRLAFVNATSVLVMIVTFIAIGILNLPLIWVVAIITPISVALSWPRGKKDNA
jgi:chromate transporter